MRSGGPGSRLHDAFPLLELLCPGLLPLLHHLQVQWPESSAFWKCIQPGVTHLFMQLCKVLFSVTFFPTWEGGICDLIGEFMKASVDMADPDRPKPCRIPECWQGGIQDHGCPGLGHC